MAETKTRFDVFDPGDRTALVCVDDTELHNVTVDQLTALGYRIHTGLFVEDIALKLKTHSYDAVVVYEHFADSDIDTNAVLTDVNAVPLSQRRNQFVVLIGSSMVSNDEMQAFRLSVDLVLGISDLHSLSVAMSRAAARREAFYRVFKECETMAGVM